MHESQNNKFREKELIRQYENFVRSRVDFYFDEEPFLKIIGYYVQSNRIKEAILACENGLNCHNYSIDIILEKIQLLIGCNQLEKALDLTENTLLVYPNDPELLLQKGDIFQGQELYEESIQCYEAALEDIGDKDVVYFSMGLSYQELFKHRKAIKYYKKALEVNPLNQNALNELTFCLESIGELEKGENYCERFLDEEPYSEYVWFLLGSIQNKSTKYKEAIHSLEFATAIRETLSPAWEEMGRAYIELEKYDKALACFLKIQDIEDPSPTNYFYMAVVYEKLEQFEQAIKYYHKGIKLDQMFHQSLFGLGSCLLKQDKCFEAIHFLKKAIKYEKEISEYWHLYALAEWKTGNIVSALEAYQKANELDAYNPKVWLEWSLIYYEQGEYEQASLIIEEALDEMPLEGEILYRSVVYLMALGKYKEAISRLETALIIDYDMHTLLFDFFEDLSAQKALHRIIQLHKKS